MAFLTSSDKALWHLALPMIFSNITVPLLGLVDTAVIGHLDSPVYLGGVAVGATATSFLFMLLLFLRMSTTGLTAQAYGAKNPQALARALVQPLLLALGAGALIALLRTPIIDLALHIVGGSEAVLEQARRFLEIRWLSAPASLANLVLLGWLLGVQYARAPVILLVVGNILNIVLDVWLVMGLHMNVQGAALATVIAEYATLLIGLLMVHKILKTTRNLRRNAKKLPGEVTSVTCWHLTAISCCARCCCNSVSARSLYLARDWGVTLSLLTRF